MRLISRLPREVKQMSLLFSYRGAFRQNPQVKSAYLGG
jgi:hypothetical protein